MTTPTEAPREALPDLDPKRMLGYDAIRYVAGYPESYVKEYAASLLESERQAHAADTVRMDWMDKNPGRIKHSTGYRGAPDSWVWTDINGYGHDAANLRDAIDQAIARGTK